MKENRECRNTPTHIWLNDFQQKSSLFNSKYFNGKRVDFSTKGNVPSVAPVVPPPDTWAQPPLPAAPGELSAGPQAPQEPGALRAGRESAGPGLPWRLMWSRPFSLCQHTGAHWNFESLLQTLASRLRHNNQKSGLASTTPELHFQVPELISELTQITVGYERPLLKEI